MNNSRQLLQIRSKKLGLLIFDARKAYRRSIEECAEAMNVSPEQFQSFESGAQSPSLPQLELLALFLNIPLEHFWGKKSLSQSYPNEILQEKERILLLRDRVVGTNLRLARNSANLSYTDLAQKSGISGDQLSQYELGEKPISAPELDLLADILQTPLERFYDLHGPIARWRAQQGNVQKFLELPPEVQEFIIRPVHRPYLDLAMRLSELSAEKLRAVAEVLLEITY